MARTARTSQGGILYHVLNRGNGRVHGKVECPQLPRTKNSIDPDYTRAKKAIEAKDWPEAIRLLRLAESRQEKSADIANLLGYAERNQGNMDAAFAHYAKALQLDPKHRGAHEYVGEAYLMVGNLAKAEEHLTALGKLCRSSCEEFDDLKKSIDDYKRKQSG